MFRIDNVTAVPSLPIAGPAGSPGFFTDGNPAAALEATVVDGWWLNLLQEEVLTVVEEAGLAPDKSSHRQLFEALNRLYLGIDAAGRYLPLTGGTIYAPGGSDPLTIRADAGSHARIKYIIGGAGGRGMVGWRGGVSRGIFDHGRDCGRDPHNFPGRRLGRHRRPAPVGPDKRARRRIQDRRRGVGRHLGCAGEKGRGRLHRRPRRAAAADPGLVSVQRTWRDPGGRPALLRADRAERAPGHARDGRDPAGQARRGRHARNRHLHDGLHGIDLRAWSTR